MADTPTNKPPQPPQPRPEPELKNSVSELLAERERIQRELADKYQREITVMFTDIKDSTAFFEDYGDFEGRHMVETHNTMMFPIIKDNGGRVVKTIGDAIMAWFESPVGAVQAALKMQERLRAFNEGEAKVKRWEIHIRIGLNTGVGFVEEHDIYGDVVNVAARVESTCDPDQIVISETTYQAVRESLETLWFRHMDTIQMKGKAEPVKLFQVLADQAADDQYQPDSAGSGDFLIDHKPVYHQPQYQPDGGQPGQRGDVPLANPTQPADNAPGADSEWALGGGQPASPPPPQPPAAPAAQPGVPAGVQRPLQSTATTAPPHMQFKTTGGGSGSDLKKHLVTGAGAGLALAAALYVGVVNLPRSASAVGGENLVYDGSYDPFEGMTLSAERFDSEYKTQAELALEKRREEQRRLDELKAEEAAATEVEKVETASDDISVAKKDDEIRIFYQGDGADDYGSREGGYNVIEGGAEDEYEDDDYGQDDYDDGYGGQDWDDGGDHDW